ncbi:hypothetical protein HanPI659440_Chr10g0398981 [Helianthus annuus]|nr:hypothetical protein HanPI659440_Chr10g0398981 [Helianthus annuus]
MYSVIYCYIVLYGVIWCYIVLYGVCMVLYSVIIHFSHFWINVQDTIIEITFFHSMYDILLKEEEKAAQEWEKKMAFVLVNHEAGLIFEALAEGLKSRHAEICMECFVSATWLLDMLTHLPEMGIQETARICLLKRFVSIFKSAKDTEDKTIAMLALSSFIHDPDGIRDITIYKKDISKGLREFKKSSTVAFEMLKVFSEGSESSIVSSSKHPQNHGCTNPDQHSISRRQGRSLRGAGGPPNFLLSSFRIEIFWYIRFRPPGSTEVFGYIRFRPPPPPPASSLSSFATGRRVIASWRRFTK